MLRNWIPSCVIIYTNISPNSTTFLLHESSNKIIDLKGLVSTYLRRLFTPVSAHKLY